MSANLRSQLVAGKRTDYSGAAWGRARTFESGFRRGRKLMCDGCKRGMHSLCESQACPCVCNDSDFRFVRRPKDVAALTSDHELAHVLMVRPELQELFR